MSKLEQKRQRAINSLMKCEIEFCEELKKGITTYMMPLTQDILSENSQRTIFMNLERVRYTIINNEYPVSLNRCMIYHDTLSHN